MRVGVAAILACAGAVGCDPDKVENAVGDATIAIGGLVAAIPCVVGQVIGAALVVAGCGVKIYLATKDGSLDETVIPLSEEQGRTVEKARAAGEQFIVRRTDGATRRVQDFTGRNPYIEAFEEARRG